MMRMLKPPAPRLSRAALALGLPALGLLAPPMLFPGPLPTFSLSAQEPTPTTSSSPQLEPVCEAGRISDVFIDNHSLFRPETLPEDGRIRWAYELANTVHIRTRQDFISSQLLFAPGDCFDPLLVRESARLLREFRFLASVDAYSVPQPDGSRHVVVDTRDDWTTKLSVGVRVEDGLRFEGISMVEENFLGRGATVGVFFLDREEQREAGARVEIPRLRRSGWDLEGAYSRTRAGNSVRESFVHPFEGEVGRFAFRQSVAVRQDLFTWVAAEREPFSHLVAPLEVGRVQLTGAARTGRPGQYLVLGGGVSREWIRPGGLESVERVEAGNYNLREPADPAQAILLAGQLQRRETNRVNLIAGFRGIRFEERRGLDALNAIQDVPTGTEALLSLGRSLGSSGPGDTFARLDLFGGIARPATVGQLFVSFEGRRRDGPDSATRDVLGELHGFLYRALPLSLPQTLLLRVAAQGAWRTTSPFQLTLGGPDGLRSLGDLQGPAARRIVVSAEDRIWLPGPASHLIDLGLTLFGDLGRSFDGDIPFAADSGWGGALGIGIRAGFPAGSASVIRADLAFPVGIEGTGSPVLRIHAREWLGILNTFRNHDMEQGRRSGIRGEFIGAGRDGHGR